MVYGSHPLHDDAPQDAHHGQPTVDGMADDEPHIERCHEIECHGGWDVPEVEVVHTPKAPPHGDVCHEVEHVAAVTATMVVHIKGNVEGACCQEPCRIDAHETAGEEMAERRVLGPREPQADTAQEEEDVNTHVARAPETEEGVPAVETNVEKDDEQHRRAHLLGAEAADVGKLDIGYSHFILGLGSRDIISLNSHARHRLAMM